jgi:hypothetical protein
MLASSGIGTDSLTRLVIAGRCNANTIVTYY